MHVGFFGHKRPGKRKPRARWNVGPARASARVKENRARAGMWDLYEPAPASKKRCTRGNVCRIRRVNNHVTRRYLYGSRAAETALKNDRQPSRRNRTTNLRLFCCEL